MCTSIQTNFLNFIKKLNKIEDLDYDILFQINRVVDDLNIRFNCYNTAWMSSIEEKPGGLFFPVKLYADVVSMGNLNISIMHHHYTWMTPTSIDNNKLELKNFLRKTSDIYLSGHEHVEQSEEVVRDNSRLIEHSAPALFEFRKNGEISRSGFSTIVVNKDRSVDITDFLWNSNADIYLPTPSKRKSLSEFCKSKKFQNRYLSELNKFDLPIQIATDRDVSLQNIYVYPDIEERSDMNDTQKLRNYKDASFILSDSSGIGTYYIEGDNQSGKTSLLKILYLSFLDKDKYPLMIQGKNITSKKIDSILKKAFEEQYHLDENSFAKYSQTDINDKILFIDNLNSAQLSNSEILEFTKMSESRFHKVVITMSSSAINLFRSKVPNSFTGIIKPLGHKKRSDLIEKFYRLSNIEMLGKKDDSYYLEETKKAYDRIQTFLGDHFMPPYPVFILSMLQSMVLSSRTNLEQTSYGYCYYTLIFYALSSQAKIANEKIDTYFNFLSELAFYLFEHDKWEFSEDEFDAYYESYCTEYLIDPINKVLTNILQSKLLIKDSDGSLKFGYRYIFYFLAAKKISEILNTEQGKAILLKLCNNLHKDRNANILIFTAHHSKDASLIDNATIAIMEPFERISPITLEKNDSYYTLLKDIVTLFQDDILRGDTDPREERDKLLSKRDMEDSYHSIRNENIDQEEDVSEINNDVASFQKAIRAIDILGQIIKNRQGSIPKSELKMMIEELYLTAFRTISFWGVLIGSCKGEITDLLKEKIDESAGQTVNEEKIQEFLNIISFNFCLSIFSRVIDAIGDKNLNTLFDEVSRKISSPASVLVTFSLKTAFSPVNMPDLRELVKQYSDNPVFMRILKARIRSYIYNNDVDYKKKQQIASLLKFTIPPSSTVKK